MSTDDYVPPTSTGPMPPPQATPDLCCTHGERIDRAVELLEMLAEARAGKPCATCEERKREEAADTEQFKQEFMARHGLKVAEDANGQQVLIEEKPKFATGGYVKAPEGSDPFQVKRGCDFVIMPDEMHLFTKDRPFPAFKRLVFDRPVQAGQDTGTDHDGQSATVATDPQVGWFVPEGTDICPHCGDQNFHKADRLCISCNHDHPDHHIPLDCEHFCRRKS